MAASADLSDKVKARIEEVFPASEQAQAAELLLQYKLGREIERVHLGALDICESDLGKLQRLVKLANRDYRDLIVAAEYSVTGGTLTRKPRRPR